MRIATYELSDGAPWQLRAHRDSLIGQRIAEAGKPYEWPMLEHIRDRRPEGLAVDVGAHIGNHSLYFAVACGMEVVAFEPIFHAELRANVALNDLEDRIRVEAVALGAAPGEAADSRERVMDPGEDRSAGSQGRLIVGPGPFEVRTLDSYELDEVGLMKIDVEGMEPDVLAGAAATIERCRPAIYAEAAGEDDHERAAALLEPWGYTATARFKHGTPRDEWLPG